MAARRTRGNGEGSVYQRLDKNGKVIGWRGQQYVGDKRKSYSGKTKQEVLDKMDVDRVDYKRGAFVDASDITVGQWAEYWLEHEKKPFVKPQTFILTKQQFEKHIYPLLRDVKLQDLTKEKIEKAYRTTFVKSNGKLYSANYGRNISTQFKGCLKSAVQDGYLIKNPHDNVKLPKLVSPKAIEAFDLQSQQKLINYLKRSKKPADWLLYLLLATGMRVGEAIALTWDDVDLEKKTIAITKTQVYVDNHFEIQPEPKSEKGIRTISIPDNVVTFLRKTYSKIDQDKNVKNILIPNRKYNYFTNSVLRYRLAKVCAILDVPRLNIHALRHTWATRALEARIPIKVVSEMLGHENVAFTMNVYQSVLRDTQEEAVDILNDLY